MAIVEVDMEFRLHRRRILLLLAEPIYCFGFLAGLCDGVRVGRAVKLTFDFAVEGLGVGFAVEGLAVVRKGGWAFVGAGVVAVVGASVCAYVGPVDGVSDGDGVSVLLAEASPGDRGLTVGL